MSLNKNLFTLLTVAAVSFSGCNSSSDDSTPSVPNGTTTTGVFLDSAVEGLDYTCTLEPQVRQTDAKGTFTCLTGSTITFKIGKYELGSTPVAAVITPKDLSDDNTTIINIAQLLQSIDTDGDPSNGIVIDHAGTAYTNLENNTSVVEVNASNFDSAILSYIGKSTLVSEANASAHLEDTLNNITTTD